jgi:hypothetical protein
VESGESAGLSQFRIINYGGEQFTRYFGGSYLSMVPRPTRLGPVFVGLYAPLPVRYLRLDEASALTLPWAAGMCTRRDARPVFLNPDPRPVKSC